MNKSVLAIIPKSFQSLKLYETFKFGLSLRIKCFQSSHTLTVLWFCLTVFYIWGIEKPKLDTTNYLKFKIDLQKKLETH